LHPEIPAEGLEMPAELRARFGGMSEHLRDLAADAGLPMVVPERIPCSRLALEAAEFARLHGRHEQFHHVLFRKFYGEGQDLQSWTVLKAAAAEVGLDPEAMESETTGGFFAEAVDAVSDQAKALGIRAVPAYVLGQRFAIMGVQPFDVFRQTMAKLIEEQAAD
jgi:predicted DsbA family dithiol-disulfide isomerase